MRQKLVFSLVIAGVVLLVLRVAHRVGLFGGWQNRLSDSLFQERPANEEIVTIAIDDESLLSIGRWPWSRSVHAELVEILARAGPKVVGIDISFLEPESEAADGQLAKALAGLDRVVMAGERVEGRLLLPIELFREQAEAGIVNTIAESDGITRFTWLEIDEAGARHRSFAAAVAGLDEEELDQVPLEQERLRINFIGPPGSYQSYSYRDVLDGWVKPEELQNKIVLIGVEASDLHDTQMVPTSNGQLMAGVEIQANAIQTLLERKYLVPQSSVTTWLIMAVLAVGLALVTVMGPVWLGGGMAVVALVGYWLYAIVAFDRGSVVDLIFPPLAILGVWMGGVVYKYFSEYRQKRLVRRAMGYYLSPAVMEEVLSHPSKLELGGRRREMTVLFSDIAGFTSISEKLEPEQLSALLNHYLLEMSQSVFDEAGVVDKYIGDAVMAFWGAPIEQVRHAERACRTALAMQAKAREISRQWQKEGAGELMVRIGINTGEMVVGNMGSKLRFDYTVIGDNVNLASRLEGIGKQYGVHLVISEATYQKVKDAAMVRELDVVAVKGKAEGVRIYELVGWAGKAATAKELVQTFGKMRALYVRGEFGKAKMLCQEMIKKWPEDGPTGVYLDRCLELAKHPPKDWDGIFHASSK